MIKNVEYKVIEIILAKRLKIPFTCFMLKLIFEGLITCNQFLSYKF